MISPFRASQLGQRKKPSKKALSQIPSPQFTHFSGCLFCMARLTACVTGGGIEQTPPERATY